MLIASFDCVTARVHQVCFAQAHAAVEIQRIVGATGSFGDG
jgi:hypothetical protein